MIQTFEKEITFLNPAYFDPTENKHVEGGKEETKTALFKELSRVDRDQRGFQFKLTSIFKSKNTDEIQIDHEVLCDIAEQFIDVLLIPNEQFTEQDKKLFLNDNVAVIHFALWLLKEKLTPFFAQLVKSLAT